MLAPACNSLLPARGEKVPEGRMRGAFVVALVAQREVLRLLSLPGSSTRPRLRSPLTRLRHPLPAAQGEGMEYAHRFDPHAPRHFPADAICSLLPASGEKVAGGRMRGAFAVALRAPRELPRALLLPGLRTPPRLRSPLTRLRHPLPAAQGEGMRTWPLLARSSQSTTSTALAGSSLLPACGEKVAGGRMRGAFASVRTATG